MLKEVQLLSVRSLINRHHIMTKHAVTRLSGVLCFFFLLLILLVPGGLQAEALIVDHQSVAAFDSIPVSVVDDIQANWNIWYGHQSHGHQLITGMQQVQSEDPSFVPPTISDNNVSMGSNYTGFDSTACVGPVRSYLNANSSCNMVMLGWCSQQEVNTEEQTNAYLTMMENLEVDYPGVTFVYMTGHIDDEYSYPNNVTLRNNQIRDYCCANDKVLYDFADIESWDPDANFYPNDDDECYWCADWCATHSYPDNQCSGCPYCQHSHCFNC